MSLEEALQELREYCRGMPPVAAMQVEVEFVHPYLFVLDGNKCKYLHFRK